LGPLSTAVSILMLALVAAPGAAPPKPQPPPPLLDTLAGELSRNFSALRAKANPAPYFISYRVNEQEDESIDARQGAVFQRSSSRRRTLECSVRVGSPQLDNYHLLDGDRPRFTATANLPIEDYPDAIRQLAWSETDRAWRAAAERLLRVKSSAQSHPNSTANPEPPDFSSESPVQDVRPVPRYRFSADEWAARLKRASAAFSEFSGVLNSSVGLSALREVKSLVTTEGARLQHGRNFYRIVITANAKGYDGIDLSVMESFEAEDPARLPKDDTLLAAVRKAGRDLSALLKAPPADPYVGPAILSGRAAGVFFHEIFGHRIEGQRQRDITEGQTFSTSLGKPVLPPFLSVTFDPTRHALGSIDLNGWYDFDDEGVPARRVPVIEQGILKTFLMSRMPLAGIGHSNGHGRAQPGMEPISRQSNLLVESSRQVPAAGLRKLLIEEIRKQNKPYGLYFEQVTGGYTTTRRQGLQAFTVIPLVVYRVYPDGRPDELVRGADIVGTPLASFAKILATSDQPEVFNGYCGAESGSVPVSALSPSLLISEIEIQRKPQSKDMPPLLPRPRAEASR
jgi:predicted Zn-dependent protease